MEGPKPRFTGIFTPVEILDREDLSFLEKVLLSWIDALFCKDHGGCYASNEYLALRLMVQENTIAKAITNLRRLDLISDVSFNGRTRVIRTNMAKYVDECQSKAGLDLNPRQGWRKIQPRVGEKSNASYIESKEESKVENRESASKAGAYDLADFNSSSDYQTSSKKIEPSTQHNIHSKTQVSKSKVTNSHQKHSILNKSGPPDLALVERRHNVFVSDFSHEALIKKHGKDSVEDAYTYLSEWKEDKTAEDIAKGTDQGRLKKWVFRAVREENIKERELNHREERLKNSKTRLETQKESIQKKLSEQFTSGEVYGGCRINFNEFEITFFTLAGYVYKTINYKENGFWDQVDKVCKDRGIKFKNKG